MSRPYRPGTYIFPPRPEHKIPADSLDKYDTGEYIAEPKLNGSNCELYIDPSSYMQKNRHGEMLTNFKLKDSEVLALHRGNNTMLLNGEYMNKAQNDKFGKPFNHKFVIFDILVYNGEHLVGTTFEDRYNMLLNMFDVKDYDEYLYQIDENVFMVKKFDKGFKKLYNEVVKIDMLEGWVLKKRTGKLEAGTREKNNVGTQLKVRKETKNYKF